MKRTVFCCCFGAVLSLLVLPASAGDWTQFRGPGGSAVAADADVPTQWSEKQNLKWKTPLPGPGSSSPIVVGKRVYITCYAGFGTGGNNQKPSDLKRVLLAIDRDSGKIAWSTEVKSENDEDPYRGFITEHGYASSTPACDGERIFAFFGKTGLIAFDMEGKILWKTGVGTESGRMRWGSGASPILYGDYVIVNASEESQSIRALDKKTGKEAWKAEAAGLASCWSTPSLVTLPDGKQQLVVAVPYEIWGLDPETGKLKWYAETRIDNNVSPSLAVDGDVVYAMGGRSGGCTAVRAGGKDDVTDTHVLWTSRSGSYVPSPLLYQGHLYWANERGIVSCLNAKDGKEVYQQRLSIGGGRGGFGGSNVYASMVLAGDKLVAVTRRGGTFVLAGKPKYESLAHNRIEGDDSDFNATPAISGKQMFLRSNRFLYCIANMDEQKR